MLVGSMLGSGQVETSQKSPRNPDTICELCPLTSLVTRFRFYGTATQRPLFFAGVTVYVMNSDFFVPAFCFKAPSFVHLSSTFSNSRRSVLGLCFTCCTNPVQPHKCLKWVQLMAISPDFPIARTDERTTQVISEIA